MFTQKKIVIVQQAVKNVIGQIQMLRLPSECLASSLILIENFVQSLITFSTLLEFH